MDYSFGGLFVQVIANVLMSIVITCIAMGVSGSKLNGLVQLLSHLLWVMLPLLGPLLSARYVVHTFMHYFVSCSNNIHPFHIYWNV